MRRLFFLITIQAIVLLVLGQNEITNYAKQLDVYSGQLKTYYDSISFRLLNNLDKSVVRYTVLPSFAPEYVLALNQDSLQNYWLITQKCTENYWYAEKKTNVKIIKNTIAIERQFGESIKLLFETAIPVIKINNEYISGTDGISYYFTEIDSSNILNFGFYLSPNKESLIGRLVDLCEEIILFTNGETINYEEIIKRIHPLTNDFKNMYCAQHAL